MTAAELATRQLRAYNAAHLDDFCACFHDDVVVTDGGDEVVRGALAFRLRYAPLFASGAFGADISERLIHGDHCIEVERWWRVDPTTGERREGEVIVHYTVIDGKIGMVRFYR